MQTTSLKQTILIFIYAFVAGICLLTFVPTYLQQQSNLRAEFLARGKALAKNLTYNSRDSLQNRDAKTGYLLIDSLMREPDIRWVAIRDREGTILVESGVNGEKLEAGQKDASERVETVRIQPHVLAGHETVIDIQVESRMKQAASAQAGSVSELDLMGGGDPSLSASQSGESEIFLGAVHVGMSLKNLQLKQKQITLQMVFIFIIALALSTAAGLYFSNSFLQPINQLVTVMEAIASSRGDLTQRIELNRKDELGRLARSFNVFIENIQQIVLHTSSLINQMSQSLEEISATAEELNSSSNHINENIQSFTHDLFQQEEVTNTTTTTINRVASTLLVITRKSEGATRIFEETEEVSRQGRDTVQDSIVKIKSISESMDMIENRMKELGQSLDKINEFVESIQSIASQTNLLSLNAAIEAARAGEAGRGFSVVAEEVRKLAENAAVASKQVQSLISAVGAGADATSEATRQGSQYVRQGTETVYQAGEALDKILRKADQAANVSVEVSKEMREQMDVLKAMMERVEQVQTLGRNNFQTAQHMASSVEEQNTSLKQITDSIQQLNESASRVKQMIVEFRVQ